MKRPLTPAELDRLFDSRNDSRNSRKPPTARKRKAAGVGPREAEARRVREEVAAAKGKGSG